MSDEVKIRPEFEKRLRDLGVYSQFRDNLVIYAGELLLETISSLQNETDWADFIASAFDWDTTPERNKFWYNISKQSPEVVA
jgi:hypothetical protein